MSTRGFIGVKIDGDIKGSYNHSDSYPDGLGQVIVDFCKDVSEDNKWDLFKQVTRDVMLVTEDDTPTKDLIKKYTKHSDTGVSSGKLTEWYCLLRGVQGIELFHETLVSDLRHWIDGVDFLKESLFCEFAYILNLDDMTIEFYEGYNEEPDNHSPLPFEQVARDEFYPVKINGVCSLYDIPETWINDFYKCV